MASESDDLAARLDRIKRLTDEYLNIKAQSVQARTLAQGINREVEAAVKQASKRHTPQTIPPAQVVA